MVTTTSLVEITDLSRNFGPVKALDSVSFDVIEGGVTGLVGENGAGKSTLLKILAGLQPPSSGEVRVEGQAIESFEPNSVLSKHSIAIVPQELSLLPDRTVAENILAGMEPGSRFFPSKRQMNDSARALLSELDLDIDPGASVRGLDLAIQQLVVVARSIARRCKVLILDEPTAMLSPAEASRLFALMAKLKEQGTTMVYVSHRMPEIFDLCDRLEVLRDGKHVASWKRDEVTPDDVVAAMVGRDLEKFEGRDERTVSIAAAPALEVKQLSGKRHDDISFEVRPGEILGIAGLPDSGRVELLANIFGAELGRSGSVSLDGTVYESRSPVASVKRRLGLLPGERRAQGILTTMTVGENIGALSARSHSMFGMVKKRSFARHSQKLAERMRVKTANLDTPITSLSGGNQQKALLARWLSIEPKVLLLDEPTRGVDVGAKVEIYERLFGLSDRGVAIICSSSDLPELLTTTDRILVMSEGLVADILESRDATEEMIMTLATNASAGKRKATKGTE